MAQQLIDVDSIYGYFSPLWPYRYDCTGAEYSLQSCSYSYYSGCSNLNLDLAGIRCTYAVGMLKQFLVPSHSHCTFSHLQGAHVLMANCNWLEVKQVMKEDWSIATKASGHLFVVWMMKKPQWPANNSGTQHTLVSAAIGIKCTINIRMMIMMMNYTNSAEWLA